MRKFLLIAAALALASCTATTCPPSAKRADSAKVQKVTICRSGWTITAGDQPDSTYTGCTE